VQDGRIMGASAFRVTYWGTTGSFARPLVPQEVTAKLVRCLQELARCDLLERISAAQNDAGHLAELLEQYVPHWARSTYGGNTTCLEIATDDALLIVDAGSGLRDLGIDLCRRWAAAGYAGPRSGHLLLTHAHFDHTFGTPFFDPLYDGRNSFTIRGPQSAIHSLNNVLSPTSEFNGIYHPASFNHLQGVKELLVVEPGSEFSLGRTRIATYPLRHPGGALAYRFERDGRRLVIATDHEQLELCDAALAEFARGADLLYADAQYLREEYEGQVGIEGEPALSRRGWGHTPVDGCVATALAAGVRRLHLGHREPKRSDAGLEQIEQLAQGWMREALAAAGRPESDCEVCLPVERSTYEI
jgi:phosphoribosyl 1,2-cyclic phosphodiesterase